MPPRSAMAVLGYPAALQVVCCTYITRLRAAVWRNHAALIFGVFFFHIRETFESLDIHHLEKLKER